MSTLLTAGASDALVTYSAIKVFTGGGVDPEGDFSTAEPDNLLFAATSGGLMLLSAGNDHTAHVRIEIWDGPPKSITSIDPANPDCPDIATGSTALGDGPIILAGIDTGFVDEVLPNPRFTGPAKVEVTCYGRTETARRYQQGELFFVGAERWLLRFWPTTRT